MLQRHQDPPPSFQDIYKDAWVHLFQPGSSSIRSSLHPTPQNSFSHLLPHITMRSTMALLALGASARATFIGGHYSSGCTYTCPASNAYGGKLFAINLPVVGILKCTYLTLFTPGICTYNTVSDI
jgi:hypothetical protein